MIHQLIVKIFFQFYQRTWTLVTLAKILTESESLCVCLTDKYGRESTNPWTVVNPRQYYGWDTTAAEGLDSRRGAYQPKHRGGAAITSSSEKCSAQGQPLALSTESVPKIMLPFIPEPFQGRTSSWWPNRAKHTEQMMNHQCSLVLLPKGWNTSVVKRNGTKSRFECWHTKKSKITKSNWAQTCVEYLEY